MNKTCLITLLWGLMLFWAAPGVQADDREKTISELADKLGNYMLDNNLKTFKPNLNEVKGFEPQRFPPSQGGIFEELLAKKLKPYGIRVSGSSRLILDANWQKKERNQDLSLQLVAKMGRFSFYSSTGLTRSPDIAEVLGTSWVAPSETLKNPKIEDRRFKQALTEKTIYTSEDGKVLYSDSETQFGAEIYVGGNFNLQGLTNATQRKFAEEMQPWGRYGAGELEGLAFTNINPGEEFSVRLINNTNYEVVANLKVDGVNNFYFSDSQYQIEGPNGRTSKNKYWVIPAKTKVLVSGWWKRPDKSQRFKITPFEESAVFKAGLPAKDVGMITVKFHGSWKGKRTDNFVANMPPGEPRIKYQETVTVPYVENRMETTTIRVPVKDKNGNITYRMEQRTRTRPVTKYRYQTKTAVGFGTDVISNPSQQLDRIVGVPRGTISFRYK